MMVEPARTPRTYETWYLSGLGTMLNLLYDAT